MNHLSLVRAGATLGLFANLVLAQTCHDFGGVRSIAEDLLQQFPNAGNSCVRIEQRGLALYEEAFGSFTVQEVVPIASATKTLSAAVLLSLADSGLLSLDDRVGQYLPEWNTGLKALITLRMCFTHTSGLPADDPAVGSNTLTLRQAAMQLAGAQLQSVPGTTFVYGGVSMHVAGAVCEVVSGQSWNQLFTQRIAVPLQLMNTDYGAFGTASNPRIAGGARSDLRDFARFVDMLRNDGVWNGTTVLSAQSVAAMLSDQTSGLVIGSTPHPDSAPYGVGIWIERQDSQGNTLLAEAAGAFGFIGWVDRAHDASGVFLTQFFNQTTFPFVRRIFDECDAVLQPDGVACRGVATPACADDVWLNGTSGAQAANVDFEILCNPAPSGAPGLIVLGSPLPFGVLVADLVAFVGLQQAVAVPMVADASGNARLAAPLSPALAGASFDVQSVWLTPNPCTLMNLQASHALTIVVAP